MCDFAYVVLLDKLERQVLADRQGLLASGVREELPTFSAERDRLDAALAESPEEKANPRGLSVEQLELRRALGVA